MEPSTASIGFEPDGSYFEDDDGNRYYGDEGERRAAEYFGQAEEHNRRYVNSLTAGQLEGLKRVLLERATPPSEEVERVRAWWRLRQTRKASGVGLVTPVGTRTDERARESRPRRSVQRSSARSGDSGDDGPGEPPRGRRLESRAEIEAWAEERHRVLSALIQAEGLGQQQLRFDESGAA